MQQTLGKMSKQQKICVFFACVAVICVIVKILSAGSEAKMESHIVPGTKERPRRRIVCVEQIDASRSARGEIEVSWKIPEDVPVDTYFVMRRLTAGNAGADDWELIVQAGPEELGAGENCSVTDQVEGAQPQQYEYRVDMKIADTEHFAAREGRTVLSSNLLLCIDPGHFGTESKIVDAESYGYAESTATLQMGLRLQEVLKAQYGIDSYLTRETDDITLEGYTNEELDSRMIALRGEYAAGSDFFISLHTNSNADNANDCPTFEQPLAINKTIILANRVAYTSPSALLLCNAVGEEVTKVNNSMGLSTNDTFRTVDTDTVLEWTIEYNDSLDAAGTVCLRLGSKGDYYGVLRGATEVDVPGIIIEHGFHSAPDVRRAAMEGELLEEWVQADARGIARGFGFQ